MAKEGVDTFIEIGPSKVLAGLNKRIIPDAKVYSISDKESLENAITSSVKGYTTRETTEKH